MERPLRPAVLQRLPQLALLRLRAVLAPTQEPEPLQRQEQLRGGQATATLMEIATTAMVMVTVMAMANSFREIN